MYPASGFREFSPKNSGEMLTGGIENLTECSKFRMQWASLYMSALQKNVYLNLPSRFQNYQKRTRPIQIWQLPVYLIDATKFAGKTEKWPKPKLINNEISNHKFFLSWSFRISANAKQRAGTLLKKSSFPKIYIDRKNISLHFLSPEPIQYVDHFLPINMIGDYSHLENVFRLKAGRR